ncbi:DgyrCDS1989 [Dimorphilus gyrociliatus]|uniref:(S)-2-hydroxy-acid oxidase n=1 Tax=Dimorphilus gyrociliatus TaxID=2664684 RepID=A0A7I8VC20_9ANNE|nr:DgyrCDS1989 [Dimorphilus gyrociliatus]
MEETQSCFCLEEMEKIGREKMDKSVAKYIYGGADQHQAVSRNREAIKEILLAPKVCAGISKRDLSTTILGQKVDMPIGFSPTMCRAWITDEGEIYAAIAAGEANIPFGFSSFTETSIEDVGESMADFENPLKIMQMSIYPEKEMTMEIIKRIKKAGFQAIAVTVDHPVHGRRDFDGGDDEEPEIWQETGLPNFPKKLLYLHEKEKNNKDPDEIETTHETWQQITDLKEWSGLKVVVKGIARPEDAEAAIKAGADAIWVSNHGGRQLGDGPATIDCLRKIAPVVKKAGVDLYIDGGFRTGSDVLKALALGANAVFIGRPVLSAIAYNGYEGVKEMLGILRKELDISMALCGCSKLSDIDQSILWE